MGPSRDTTQEGFTLVEILVASVILIVALSGTAALMNATNRQNAASGRRYEQQGAIDSDLAEVYRRNDRYTCASGTTCTSAGGTDPGKDGFYPPPSLQEHLTCPTITVTSPPISPITTKNCYFENRCRYVGGVDLVTALANELNGLPQPAFGVTRTVISNQQGNAHRYTVVYTDGPGGVELRRVTLVPTTASWCP